MTEHDEKYLNSVMMMQDMFGKPIVTKTGDHPFGGYPQQMI